MNPSPFIRGVEVHTIDGQESLVLAERAFWQSRMVVNGQVPPLPEIVRPEEIVKELCHA